MNRISEAAQTHGRHRSSRRPPPVELEGDGAAGGKQKLSRKAQLKELAANRRKVRHEEALDPDFEARADPPEDVEMADVPVAQPGAAAKRQDAHAVETRVTIAGVTCNRHLCLLLPKCHCELNWIERLWGASKAYCRSHCMYTLQGLRDTVPLSLSQDISDLPDG